MPCCAGPGQRESEERRASPGRSILAVPSLPLHLHRSIPTSPSPPLHPRPFHPHRSIPAVPSPGYIGTCATERLRLHPAGTDLSWRTRRAQVYKSCAIFHAISLNIPRSKHSLLQIAAQGRRQDRSGAVRNPREMLSAPRPVLPPQHPGRKLSFEFCPTPPLCHEQETLRSSLAP